jgi:hypothetical protein
LILFAGTAANANGADYLAALFQGDASGTNRDSAVV